MSGGTLPSARTSVRRSRTRIETRPPGATTGESSDTEIGPATRVPNVATS